MLVKAAVSNKAHQPLTIEQVQLDAPKDDEVLVKVVATGVCHTDAEGRDGATSPLPVALGHEGSGIVEAVGDNIHDLKKGDHVILSFSYCGECRNCREGHPGMCERFNELNFGGVNHDGSHRIHQEDGKNVSTFFGQSSFADHVVAHRNNVIKVNPDVDLRYLGPLGCGIQTGAGTVLNYLKPKSADSIAIFGTGGVGLAAIMAAKLAGLKHIFAINRNGNRLDLAKELGATDVINNTTTDPAVAIKKVIPRGVDYAIDTTGNAGVIKSALASLATAGECVLLGIGGDLTINMMADLLAESKKLSGVVEGDSQPQKFIPQMVEYYKEGRFPIDKLVKFYDFAKINDAFAASKDGSVIKPIVIIDQDYQPQEK